MVSTRCVQVCKKLSTKHSLGMWITNHEHAKPHASSTLQKGVASTTPCTMAATAIKGPMQLCKAWQKSKHDCLRTWPNLQDVCWQQLLYPWGWTCNFYFCTEGLGLTELFADNHHRWTHDAPLKSWIAGLRFAYVNNVWWSVVAASPTRNRSIM